jgi:exosortase
MPAFVAACWALAVRHLATDWSFYEQYHYGWLVPLLALYLAKMRAEHLPRPGSAPRAGTAAAAIVALAVAAALSLPLREANTEWRTLGWWFSGLAVAATALGLWQLGGREWPRHFAFPLLFFFTAVPIFRQVEEPVMSWLMQRNATVSVEVLRWFGVAAEARGNLIALSGGTLGVDQACSGIRSLQGTLMLTLFLGEFLALKWPRRVVLLGAGFGFALLTNVVRTVALGFVAARDGLRAVDSWHDPAGYAVLAVCSVLVAATAWLLARGRSAGAAGELALDFPKMAERSRRLAAPALVGLAVLAAAAVATEVWFRMHERSAVTPLVAWRFQLPKQQPGFEESPIPTRTRADLRCDIGYAGRWHDEAARRWQAFYFQWWPGKNAVQTVAVHDPRRCLAAVGMKGGDELPRVEFARGEIRLAFDAFEFLDGTQPVFVFNCLAEDVRRGEAHRSVREDNTIASRFSAALAGKRHLGQRRLEVAVWGAADAADARAAFLELLDRQLAAEAK